jgi:deoxyribodipyrimidine photo-lyase
MATQIIQPQRITHLNDCPVAAGDYVLYWMQQSQRAAYNHALEYAIQQANAHDQPLLVAFGLMADYPEANLRHYTFMLEGLQETQEALARRGIKMVVQHGQPPDVALALSSRASLIVCDRGYLRHQKAWRRQVAEVARCRVVQVESDVVVPVGVVTDKAEYAARTFRPRLKKHLDDYLMPLRTTPLAQTSMALPVHGLDLQDLHGVLDTLDLDTSVEPVSPFFRGGLSQAKRHLRVFIKDSLSRYDSQRNQPHEDAVSYLSPYLHFGQISPLYIALRIHDSRARLGHDQEVYLEELLVRRELAMNYVHFNPDYDAFTSLPRWAQETLADHKADARDPVYTRQELEQAATHDPYWNAAMRQMKHMGYLHNHMRMYWGKKILA